jgi:Spy/CpxP family protein refolding chaperone
MRKSMKTRLLKNVCLLMVLLTAMGLSASAQHPGGGPGGPGGGMGGPGGAGNAGGPGGPGGRNAPPPSPSNSSSSNSKAQSSSSASTGGGVQFGPVGRWWDDKTVVKSVGLSSVQKTKMDAIFDANKPAILAAYKNLLKEQAKLSAVSKDPNADKSSTFAAIDAVNQARSQLAKAVAQTYLEIRQQMSMEQIEKLQKLQ